jgi:alcohol dehydrogenase
MKAVAIYSHGELDQLKYVTDFPDPKIGPDDVLVRIRATSYNYHDIFDRRGMPGIRLPFPFIMGMDFAGEVVECGSNVQGWAIGSRVLVDPRGADAYAPGTIGHGGLAEYYAANASRLIALPDTISFEEAAALPVAYGTALRMVETIGQVKAGEKVLLLGASGGVGVCALMLCKMAGAEVIACGSSEEKGVRLKQLGADHFINYATEDFEKATNRLVGRPSRANKSAGVDVVINYTGGDTWVPSIRTLKQYGRVLTCGATAGFDPVEDIRHIWTYERQIKGSNGWQRSDLLKLIDLVTSKKLAVLIEGRFPLTESAEAMRVMEDRKVFGKIVVTQ